MSIRVFLFGFYIVIFVCNSAFNLIFAQENTPVNEPPIPVYIVCPYHEDSLRAAYTNSLATNGSTLGTTDKKYDSLNFQIQKSTAENTTHFIWLFTLIALLGTMNIVLLFTVSRIRKEVNKVIHLEHQQKLIFHEPPPAILENPEIVEPLPNQESTETQTQIKLRGTRTRKSRS